jgi:hypothetical protein
VKLGIEALQQLGQDSPSAQETGRIFADYDEESLTVLADLWGDDRSYGVAVRQRLEDLKQVLIQDRETKQKQTSNPPRK